VLVLLCNQAVLGARESLEGCFEVLQPQLAEIGCTWDDFLWAVQVCMPAAQSLLCVGQFACFHAGWLGCRNLEDYF
jgi:hypothetical protein